jgi:predicted RNA binding protein YcfA (HicA-like mRNA interferase family)
LIKEGFEIKRIRGSHIIINKRPPLNRSIVVPNKEKLSNVVRLNLIRELKENDINTEEIESLLY